MRRIWGAMRAWAASISVRVMVMVEPSRLLAERPDGDRQAVSFAAGRVGKGLSSTSREIERHGQPRKRIEQIVLGRAPRRKRLDQALGQKAGPAQQLSAQVHAGP